MNNAKIFNRYFVTFFSVVLTFLLFTSFYACEEKRTNYPIHDVVAKLEDTGFDVYHAQPENVVEFLDSGFGLSRGTSSFTRGVFAVHSIVPDHFVYIIYCSSSSVADSLGNKMKQNLFAFAYTYEVNVGDITCLKIDNVIYCGITDAVDLVTK